MVQPPSLMAALGHVAQAQTLRRHGIRRRDVEAALLDGRILRIRRGWFATPDADADQLRAVALGGRIGCVSALRRWGVWSGAGDRLHVQLAPNASRLRLEGGRRASSVRPGVWHPMADDRITSEREVRLATPGEPVTHWTGLPSGDGGLDWIVSLRQALAQALRCQNDEHAIACADSVIRHGLMSRNEVNDLLAALPQRFHSLADELTPTADSGWESIFITRVRRGGFHVESQVSISGIGRLDGVIEDCVGFEVNGLEFHSGRDDVLRDTERVIAAQSFGLPMLSVTPHQLEHRWPSTWSAVARVVDDAREFRRLRGR